MPTDGYRVALFPNGTLATVAWNLGSPTALAGRVEQPFITGAPVLALETPPTQIVSACISVRRSGVVDLIYAVSPNIGNYSLFYRRSDDALRSLKDRVPIANPSFTNTAPNVPFTVPFPSTPFPFIRHASDDARGRILVFFNEGASPHNLKVWLTVGSLNDDGKDYGGWTRPLMITDTSGGTVSPWILPSGAVDLIWGNTAGTFTYLMRADSVVDDGTASFAVLSSWEPPLGGHAAHVVRPDGMLVLGRWRFVGPVGAWDFERAVAMPAADGQGWGPLSAWVRIGGAISVNTAGHGGGLPEMSMYVRGDGVPFLSTAVPTGGSSGFFLRGCPDLAPDGSGTWLDAPWG